MSVPQSGGGPIENRDQLIGFLEVGSKPAARWRIGTEHEKFGFRKRDLSPLPYDGPDGIRAMLEGLMRFGWKGIREGDALIGLTQDGPQGTASISLEPGGQFELSGAPLTTLHETCHEVNTHLDQVAKVANEIGVGFLGLGFSPKWSLAETPIMPKGRYAIMRNYMPKVGSHGLDMMFRTCTVQVNLDFSDEADMVKKMRVGLALQPIATALFANSPFTEGKPNGYLSYRARVWHDVDPDRSGLLPFVFEDGFGFERYVDYALDVPMYFIFRGDHYVDMTRYTFRQFLAGEARDLTAERATLSDWADHLTTIFPDVRLKKFIEMRGADGGPWRRLCALPALWVGLLYDGPALDAAWDLVKDWTAEEREGLRRDVPKLALATPFRGRTVRDVAGAMLEIARAGLKARAMRGRIDADEVPYLDELFAIVASGETAAQELLARFGGPWEGNIDKVFAEYAY